MYGGGGFDTGANQFNGAGFMPTQGNTGGGGASSAKKSYENKQQSLRAVTIKQLYDASTARTDDSLVVDGKELSNITIVAKVLSASETGLTYVLNVDDGTGKAAVKIWIADDESEGDKQRRAEWRPGMYVRAHGHISNFGKSQEIIAFNIRPITDYNEVTYHFLQCIFQHAHLTKGSGGGSTAAAAAGAPAAGFPVKQEQGSYGGGGGAPAGGFGAPAAGGMGGGYNPHGGLTAIQADIMALFNAPDAVQSDAGISLDDVVARAGGRYSVVQVREAVDALQNEGHLYSTIDENHFKSCNA